jgi:predicted Zn-dependent peptidase
MEVDDVIEYWTLNNGTRLIAEEIPHLRSVAIGIYIKTGSRDEVFPINGASHFIEHMLFKGTETRTAKDIAETFESIGGQLNAYTSKEYTCIYARTLDENFEQAADILLDMVFNSALRDRDISTEKGVIIEEIGMYEDSPDELIHDIFAQMMWQEHPLGQPILGTRETVNSLEREQLWDYYHSYYIPSNMVISVAGNVSPKRVWDKMTNFLAGVDNTILERDPKPPADCTGRLRLVDKDTEQVQICLGVPGISFRDESRHVQNVMNSIFGGALSSRLFQTIREDKGLAYSVYSYPSCYSDAGTYAVYVATGADKIPDFFGALREEIEKFLVYGPTEKELTRTQNQIKANVYLGLESVMNRMNRLGKSVLFYDRIIPVDEVIERVMAVTIPDICDFFRAIMVKEQLSLAAIGSKEVLPRVEDEFFSCKN